MKESMQSEPVAKRGEAVSEMRKQQHPVFSKDVRRMMQLVDEDKLFPPKYWKIQHEDVVLKVKKIYKKDPSLPVKQVVIAILSDLPDFLPSWNVHRVAGYITETWKELSKAEEAPEPTE